MGTLTDIVQLSDRILDFLKRDQKSDRIVFEELIDPLYVQLESVVKSLLEMYQPILSSLMQFRKQVREAYDERVNSIRETKEARIQLYKEILPQFDDEISEILTAFKQQRAQSRPARLKADAAAWALFRKYENRSDEFATRVRELAGKIRIIVGRAHNNPLGTFHLGNLWSMESSTEDFERILSEYAHYMRQTFIITNDELLTEQHEKEIDLTITLQARQEGGNVADLLADSIINTCRTINNEWEDLTYIYAMLRLSIIANSHRNK